MAARVANRRIRLLAAVFALVFALALARAGWLQAIRASALTRLAVSQHRETVDVPAHRGTMYDRLGFEVALGSPTVTVYANPRQIGDPQVVAVAAARTLGLDPDKLYPILADQSRGFVYVQRQADPEKAQALQRQGIVGLGFYPEEKRIYPSAASALPWSATPAWTTAGSPAWNCRSIAF